MYYEMYAHAKLTGGFQGVAMEEDAEVLLGVFLGS